MEQKSKKPYQKPKLIHLGKIKFNEEDYENGHLKAEILKRIREQKEKPGSK